MAKKRSFLKSLRGKVSLQMLVVSLLPIVLVGGLVYNSMLTAEDKVDTSIDDTRDRLEENTIGAGKALQAWNLSVDLETWMAERIEEVNSLSRNAAVMRAARSSNDENGEAWKALGEAVAGTTFYENAWLTDVSGAALAETSVYDTGDKTQKPVWQKAKDTGLCVGDAYLGSFGSAIAKVYFVDIAVRIEEPMTHTPLGIVACTVEFNPSSLGQKYGDKVPDSKVAIWTRNGELITDSKDNSRYLEENPDWNDVEITVKDQIIADRTRIIGDYAITDDDVAGYARATNEDVGVRFTGLYEGLGWMVMVAQDTETAFAALDSLQDLEDDLAENTNSMVLLLIVVIIAVVVIVPLLALFLSRGITRPIAQLTDAAEKVSMGDLDVTVTVKSDDEIGDLAESFGRMVTAVKFLSEDED